MDEKYQRIQVLGKGSFGKAYLVKNTEANELCVVKQMETSMMDKKERDEAVKEAMLLKRMDHPNIVRFQEVFMTRKGRLCIVMDYADDGDVHQHIKNQDGKLIEETRILEWFVQTCFAMKHVHERKVLHRDLKTQNIFLMKTGQIKLGDFGIARVLDATKDYAKTMVGTPYYLSPEIIEDKPYSFKSDVWSLGVVLYEMTTLKHPFDADSLVILASKILKDQYPPPDAMYSSDLQALIRNMLVKDAQQRPTVLNVLALPFLHQAMASANSNYSLGQDEFMQSLAATAAVGSDAEARGGRASPGGNLNSSLVSTRAPSTNEDEREGDDEYEEEFEDYSGSEDGEKKEQPSDLQQSVAKLKLGGGGAAPPSMAPVKEDHQLAPPLGASGGQPSGSVAAKAESLRTYLQQHVGASEFTQAYKLVRASGEDTPEKVQQKVGAVIGAEKVSHLLELFQLLVFLEDVSSQASA